MNGWMFFSDAGNRTKNISRDFEVMLETFPGMYRMSREEWNTFLPESKEPLQGASLGFFCGGDFSGGLAEKEGMPSFPMRSFVSDWVIQPSCWTYPNLLTVSASRVEGYRFTLPRAGFGVITVTGTLPDRPPSVHVYGSYCFFPPPYIFPGVSDRFF